MHAVICSVHRRAAAVLPTLSLVFLLYPPPPIARAFLYFCPLLASTGLLVVLAAYLSLLPPERLQVEAPNCQDHGAEIASVVISVRGEAADRGHVPCFVALEVRGGDDDQVEAVDEDDDDVKGSVAYLLGEESVVEDHACSCDEVNVGSSSSDEADGLAQGLWDSYFGMYSTWYHHC